MRGIKIAIRVARIALITILALLLMCNLYFIAARAITGEHPTLFGYSTAIVVSGSMSPTIEVDDMVIIHREDTYSCGDIITYKDGMSLVTHRIQEITDDGYIPKGDANNTTDETVLPDSVVGRVVLEIPKIGKLVSGIRTPFGMCVILLIGVLLIEYPALSEKIKAKKAGGENDGKHTE